MFKKNTLSIGDAVSEFRRQAAPALRKGDQAFVKQLFRKWTADARANNPEEQIAARAAMRNALREVLLEPSRRVKRGWFDDL